MSAAVGVFGSDLEARSAVEDLLRRGFPREDISLVVREDGRPVAVAESDGTGGAATGIAVGSVLGAVAGLLVGVAGLTIPGSGPILAAGPLATTLAGAAIGAATGGLLGALVDLGLPEERAIYYSDRVRAGHALITVRAPDPSSAAVAADILRQHNAADLDTVA